MLFDLRYALRLLRKSPVFTSIAVVTLALGIGLNTAVFAAIDALLFRPLPGVTRPEELVQVFRTYPGGFLFGSNSIPHYQDLRERSDGAFRDVAIWDYVAINLSSSGRTERIVGQVVSANYFRLMGVAPERGRMFVSNEDSGPGAHPVAVVSHAAWQGLFGGDPEIVGRKIVLNGTPFSIVGVAPSAFGGVIPLAVPVVWVPLMQIGVIEPGRGDVLHDRGENFMNVVARLAPGVSVDRARASMQTFIARQAEQFPETYRETGVNLVPQTEAGISPQFRTAQVGLSTVVMAVVVMLLLIACVNVANLFLARARDRAREMAVRLALGARRSRLVRQLLTESLLFATLSGAAGILIAKWGIGILNGVRPPVDIPIQADLRLDTPVLVFTLGISLLTGLLFGLAPALQATRPSLVPALRGESGGGSRSRMSRALVVAQMALSLVLLVCAGLFLRNLRSASTVEKGFASDHLLIASVDPGLQGYTRARTDELYRRLTDRLRALPSVVAVGLAEQVPLGLGSQQSGLDVPGYTPAPNEMMSIDYNIVAPGYFEALGITLRRGRTFTTQDDSAAAGVVVVNERFAERFWPGQDAIGRQIRSGRRTLTVVGLVATGKYNRLGEAPLSYIYYPQAQRWRAAMTIHIRTRSDPAALAPVLRSEVAALDPDLPLADVRTMENHLGIALLPARLAGSVLAIFGTLGLVLAAVGIYGVMSYAVAQRTREIGIRVAIGATQSQVVGLVLGQGTRLIALGAVIGLGGSVVAWWFVRGMLYGARGPDPFTFVLVPLVLVSVALVAMWVPARRAATVDPMVALRGD